VSEPESTEQVLTTSGESEATAQEVAPFAAGGRVSLRQYVLERDELVSRELGLGEMVDRPRLGERLGIRIRAERGLSSSRIQRLALLEEGRLAVVTNGRAYLLSQIESRGEPDAPDALRSRIEQLIRECTVSDPTESGDVTQYLRVKGMTPKSTSSPFVGVALDIERISLDDPEPKPESLGRGHLLADPEPGLPLRLVDGDEHLVSTSQVVLIEQDDEVLQVSTANRLYRLAPAGEND